MFFYLSWCLILVLKSLHDSWLLFFIFFYSFICFVSPTCCVSFHYPLFLPVLFVLPFSEAGSDSVHTDVDDQRSSVSEPHMESNKSSNNNINSVNSAGHNMPPYEEPTPIYVIKNLVVKPVRYSVTHNFLLFHVLLHHRRI